MIDLTLASAATADGNRAKKLGYTEARSRDRPPITVPAPSGSVDLGIGTEGWFWRHIGDCPEHPVALRVELRSATLDRDAGEVDAFCRASPTTVPTSGTTTAPPRP